MLIIDNDPIVYASLITLGLVLILFLIYLGIKLQAYFESNKRI